MSRLFTVSDNRAAQAADPSLGFSRVGEYGLVVFAGFGRL